MHRFAFEKSKPGRGGWIAADMSEGDLRFQSVRVALSVQVAYVIVGGHCNNGVTLPRLAQLLEDDDQDD
jgi:hypothetical protein